MNQTDLIKQKLSVLLVRAFENSFKQPSQTDLYHLLEFPPDPQMGDYAMPCFAFAKPLRLSPAKIAETLKNALLEINDPWIASAQVLNAFLNIKVNTKQLAPFVLNQIQDKSMFSMLASTAQNKKTVMVEFSNPNTHKEFHVGHLRNVCLGDAICRILSFIGRKVIPVNYIGDEGTHVAKALWQIKKNSESIPSVNKIDWYGKQYMAANDKLTNASEENKALYQKEISAILSELEAKSGAFYELWLSTREDCLEEFKRIYNWLDVHFEHDFFESDLTEECQSLTDEFIQKGLFQLSNGAYGIDLSADGLGFFMARKSDGTSLYITKDLVLARRKFEQFDVDESIYVVGSEQNFHFAQLFKALSLMGFKQGLQCHHLSYALVKRKEGKMSSRLGNSYTLTELRSVLETELTKQLSKHEADWSKEELVDVTKKLTIGAIKYGMLASDPGREIIFEPDAWTAFEGNTGPYLMYGFARATSILRKVGSYEGAIDSALLVDPSEHDLLMHLNQFNSAVMNAGVLFKPSVLANYLYELCRSFNRFYSNVSVMNAESVDIKHARIRLIEAYKEILKEGLNLLGITPPERM